MRYIVANWKMNPPSFLEAVSLVTTLLDSLNKNFPRSVVIFCPPLPFLSLFDQVQGDRLPKPYFLGAQNCAADSAGPFTGEVSASQLKTICQYVIAGHSERRAYFGETDQLVNQKLKLVLINNLTPIMCFGETLVYRDLSNGMLSQSGKDLIKKQLEAGLENVSKVEQSKILFAYEPIWAIGTGTIAHTEQVEEVYDLARSIIDHPTLLYGGSVTENTISEISKTSSDGVLVGGASLAGPNFLSLINTLS